MKIKDIKFKTIFTVALACASFGCKKITDINVSPNNPSINVATPQVLFPSGVMATAGAVGGELDIIGGIWGQYWTESTTASQFRTIDAYNLQRQDFNGTYSRLFAGALPDYQLAITKAKASGQNGYVLMATVMKAYSYEVLVDLYDQVPYTQALQGASNLQPKFDDGYTVYKGLLAEIDAALANPGSIATTDQKTDFLFNGDINKWVQFANTLKLKMYLRMVNASLQKLKQV